MPQNVEPLNRMDFLMFIISTTCTPYIALTGRESTMTHHYIISTKLLAYFIHFKRPLACSPRFWTPAG